MNNSSVEIFPFHEKKEQMLVQKTVKPGMTVFDVGANIGHYSILFSQLVGNYGKVYSFEPTSSTFNKLLARLKKYQCSNVFLFKKAIFSKNKLLEFNEFPDEYSSWNSIGKPQMNDPNSPSNYVPIVNTEIVEAVRLDTFCAANNIKTIDYLKIDVEGAESYVLEGAISLLKRTAISFLQFEISQKMLEGLNCQAKETFDILIENGYECHKINSDGSFGQLVNDSNSFYENYIAFPSKKINQRANIEMFWDDIKLVTEQVQKYGLREPFFDLGGLERPTIADYDLTIKTGDQYGRYVALPQRPFDHIDQNYVILNPEKGDPGIEELPTKYTNQLGTAVCLNVIEHIENPLEVFEAFYQIMKPNSLLVISTVFLFPYHPSPRDYWRYSPECLKYLSKQAGFTILECDWRLYIPASGGILEIKTQEPQEIRSVYVTLTKGEFTAKPGAIYPLPKRQSRNEIANNFIEVESREIELSSLLKEASKYQDTDLEINNLKKARQQIADLILGLPTNQLETIYKTEVGNIHQKLLESGVKDAPLNQTEKEFSKEVINKYASSDLIPEWEYVIEGWSKENALIKGWNVETILDVRKAQWSSLVESIKNTKPLANDYGQHNTKMAYGYVLTKAARTKDRISLLDWGGGLGEYYLIGKSLLPDVEIDYHCKEVPVLCDTGRELLPKAHFYDNEEDCFKQTYDLVLASSSLQYSEDWQNVAKQLAAVTDSFLYITRLPIVHKAESFVVLQRAYKYGYGTEYLGWFLNRQDLLNYMVSLGMELVREFLIAERYPVSGAPEIGEGRGFLFRTPKR